MTKSEAKSILIKDLITAGVAALIIGIIFGAFAIPATIESADVFSCIFLGGFIGLYCAGIPFGWRWASKGFIAIGWFMILVKIGIALGLGFIAFPVTIITDIVRLCKATDDSITE